jgi:endonuclease/exonuclease/phosphatase family metal-dependent hydrolase
VSALGRYPSASPAIRVATWNIRAGIGPGEPFPPAWWRHVDRERLVRIASIIDALNADVVALQEVAVLCPDGDLLDEPAELARMTGMTVRYGAAHAFALVEPEHGRAIGSAMWGNALLTRQPLDGGFAAGLPRGRDDDLIEAIGSGLAFAGVAYQDAENGVREPRCAIGGRVPDPAPGVSIVNAHLTYAGTGQRRAQVEALARIASEVGSPVIVAGDFNAPIEAAELELLSRTFDDTFAAVGIAAGDARRASCGANRIDHLLTRGLRTLDCAVHIDAGDASDHLPVVATFATTGVSPDQPDVAVASPSR